MRLYKNVEPVKHNAVKIVLNQEAFLSEIPLLLRACGESMNRAFVI